MRRGGGVHGDRYLTGEGGFWLAFVLSALIWGGIFWIVS